MTPEQLKQVKLLFDNQLQVVITIFLNQLEATTYIIPEQYVTAEAYFDSNQYKKLNIDRDYCSIHERTCLYFSLTTLSPKVRQTLTQFINNVTVKHLSLALITSKKALIRWLTQFNELVIHFKNAQQYHHQNYRSHYSNNSRDQTSRHFK